MLIDVHWRSSRLSASSLMSRTTTLVLSLVTLTAAGSAHAAPGSAPSSATNSATGRAPTKLHAKTSATSGAPATRHATFAPSTHHAAAAHTRTQAQLSTARRPTPRETGYTAGLAIRRELRRSRQRGVMSRFTKSVHLPRPARRTSARSISTRAVPATEVASTSPALLMRPARAQEPAEEEPAQEESDQPARSHPRAATPAPAQTLSDDAITNEEMDSTERESPRKSSLPADGNSKAKGEDAGTETNRIAPPMRGTREAEIPDAETPIAKTEEASLRVPLSGMPAPLFGSHESLERQNTRLDEEGLERIEDESDLVDRIARKLLVPIPASSALAVNAGLSANPSLLPAVDSAFPDRPVAGPRRGIPPAARGELGGADHGISEAVDGDQRQRSPG